MSTAAKLQAIMYEALAEPVGLLVGSLDPVAARQKFYSARSKSGDPDLARLQIRLVEIDGGPKIALVRSASVPEPKYEPLALTNNPNLTDLDL